MHIHGNSMNVNAAGLYSAANAEQSAAAQRAAETRKRLLKNASSIDAQSGTPEETLMIGQWLDGRSSQNQDRVQVHEGYPAAISGRDPDFG